MMPRNKKNRGIEERKLRILQAIVDEYIKTGEPVGSKSLSSLPELSVSSATIRNEMVALEQLGLLEQPHTSAGRVPTFKGYRLYIDRLMKPHPLTKKEMQMIDEMLGDSDFTDEAILENATAALADVTKCAAITTNLTPQFSVITKVEVIPTGRRMYLLLLIASNGSVKNRICRLEFDLTHEHIEFFQNFLQENLHGVPLEQLSPAMLQSLATALGGYMLALSPLLYTVYELTSELMSGEVEFAGHGNLLVRGDFDTTEIIKLLESKDDLLPLLTKSFSGIHVMFGKENSDFVVTNSSFVVSKYNKGENAAGSIGVIGPMRLNYAKIIPYIEYFTQKVTGLLSEEEPLLEQREEDMNEQRKEEEPNSG